MTRAVQLERIGSCKMPQIEDHLRMAHLSDGVTGVREVKGESTTAVKPPNVMATRGPPAVLSLEVYGSLMSNA